MIDLRWQVNASCAHESTSDFYLLPSDPNHRATIERLKKLCKTCPALEACRDYALRYETEGFWAGMTVSERRRVRSQEGIARRTPGSILTLIEGKKRETLRTPNHRRNQVRATRTT